MLSKGIMVLALLALVYLLLITMNNKTTENFKSGKLNIAPAKLNKPDVPVKQQPVPVKQQPVPVKQQPVPVKQQPVPVEELVVPVEEQFAPVEELVVPVEEQFAPVEEQFAHVEEQFAHVEEPFVPTNEPVIDYQENFADESVNTTQNESLIIDSDKSREYQLQYTNNFYKDSKKDKNIKNPTYDLRGESEISFDSNFTPFNSSANAGLPLRDVRLMRGDVDGNCKSGNYEIIGNKLVQN